MTARSFVNPESAGQADKHVDLSSLLEERAIRNYLLTENSHRLQNYFFSSIYFQQCNFFKKKFCTKNFQKFTKKIL
jgi:hypothetical protein